jgi:hypothetical protein
MDSAPRTLRMVRSFQSQSLVKATLFALLRDQRENSFPKVEIPRYYQFEVELLLQAGHLYPDPHS